MKKRRYWTGCLAAVLLCTAGAGCVAEAELPQPPAEEAPVQSESARLPEPEPPAQPEPEDALTPFLGVWQDPDEPACRIHVSRDGEDGCRIEINWDSGAESSLWQLAGTYDGAWEGVAYLGARCDQRVLENGGVERTPVHEEATGLLYFADSGELVWLDDFDHMGENLSFVREEQPPSA